MSRIEQRIANAWAGKLARAVIKEVISELKGMEAQLSGDSDLQNVWEEVCAQVQGEHSSYWPAYEEVIDGLLQVCLEDLDRDAQLALWAVTDEGWSYIYDHHADSESAKNAPFNMDDIVGKLTDDLLSAAANFESPSLYRYIWGEDDPEYDESDEDDTEEEDEVDDEVEDHTILGIHREQIDAFDLESSLRFLRTLVPLRDPKYAWSWKGTLSVTFSGYDDDPRELFEIPEVRLYLHALDQEWPFWFFFLTPPSIRLVGMCLTSAMSVAPGKAFLPPENLCRVMERGFGAVNHLFEHYGFPEAESEALSIIVSQAFSH